MDGRHGGWIVVGALRAHSRDRREWRSAAIDAALLGAAVTPLDVARRAARLGELAREIGTIGNKNARSDAKVAEELARTAVIGAVENVRVNVASLSDPAAGRGLLEEAERLGQ